MTVRVHLRSRRGSWIAALRWTLLLSGLGALGYCGYVYADAELYQKYENWAFDEELHGRSPNVPAFLADSTPLRRVLRKQAVAEEADDIAPSKGHTGADGADEARADRAAESPKQEGAASPIRQAIERALIGRIEIPRLKVHAIVREGVDDRTLRRAVGHVPSTALPGAPGNVGLAGHRDTFFRSLKGVRKNDRISIRTLDGEYHYVVDSLKVVGPKDVNVLAPTEHNVLTLVTCYPFNYVGNAPRRYIVRAKQVDVEAKVNRVDTDADSSSVAGDDGTQ